MKSYVFPIWLVFKHLFVQLVSLEDLVTSINFPLPPSSLQKNLLLKMINAKDALLKS